MFHRRATKASTNQAGLGFGHAVTIRELQQRPPLRPKRQAFQNMRVGHLARLARLRIALAPETVAHVVPLRPDIQMVRPDTPRHVAVMVDLHPLWNRTAEQSPRETMRVLVSEFAVETAYRELPVIELACGAPGPQPAGWGLSDKAPEPHPGRTVKNPLSARGWQISEKQQTTDRRFELV